MQNSKFKITSKNSKVTDRKQGPPQATYHTFAFCLLPFALNPPSLRNDPVHFRTSVHKKGMILVMVVLITSAILAVGLGIFASAFNQLRTASETRYSFNALYAADRGAERTLYLDRVAGPLCPGVAIDGVPDVDCYVLTDFPVGNNACVTVRVSKDIKCDNAAEADFTRIYSTGLYQCGSGELGVKRAFCLNYRPIAQNDVLQFSATTDSSAVANKYRYIRFYVSSGLIWAAGDTVEYDVYLNTNIAGLGGIEIYNTDATFFRGSGWTDQNGIAGHPAGDISAQAFQMRYSRILTVPAGMIGKTADFFDIAAEFDAPNTIGIAYYDNIVVKDSFDAVKAAIYQSGVPAENTQHLNSAYASHSLDVAPAPW